MRTCDELRTILQIANPDFGRGQMRKRRRYTTCLILGTLSFALASRARGADVYTLTPVEYGFELKTADGRVVFDYMTKKPETIGLTSPSVACFHPVNTPSGERITSIAPDDHRHHRGIFFGWHDSAFYDTRSQPNPSPTAPLKSAAVRRADFWGWGAYAPRDERVVQNRDVKLVRADANHAELEIHNDLMVQGHKMGEENDLVNVTERDGVFILDLAYTIAPLVEYRVAQNAFGGFDVQCRKDGDSYFSTAAGKVMLRDPHYAYPELDWPSEPWYDYTIRLSGNKKTLGAAVIDHPKNPATLWHNARYLWMLNPSVVALHPITIEPDAPLTLRYRVVVHDGPPPTSVLEKLSAEWRQMFLP
jgi:Methane oxygenase PmoA